MPNLNVKLAHWPEQVSQPGTYKIRSVKPPQETRFGPTVILILTSEKGEERSLFVPFSPETTEQTNLGRLVKMLGNDTDRWTDKQVDVTFDESGKRTIRPVVK
jgi:hypothetical protein